MFLEFADSRLTSVKRTGLTGMNEPFWDMVDQSIIFDMP